MSSMYGTELMEAEEMVDFDNEELDRREAEYDTVGAEKERRRKRISNSRRKAARKNSGDDIALLAGSVDRSLPRKEKIKQAQSVISSRKEFVGKNTTKKQVRRDSMKRELADSM